MLFHQGYVSLFCSTIGNCSRWEMSFDLSAHKNLMSEGGNQLMWWTCMAYYPWFLTSITDIEPWDFLFNVMNLRRKGKRMWIVRIISSSKSRAHSPRMSYPMSAADCNRMRDSRWADGSYFQQLCAFTCSFKPNFLKDRQRKGANY